MSIHPTPAAWDHRRDLLKHERRPHDLHRTAINAINATEVAALVKLIPIEQAAALIEHYADAKAAAIRLDAVAAGARP